MLRIICQHCNENNVLLRSSERRWMSSLRQYDSVVRVKRNARKSKSPSKRGTVRYKRKSKF